MAWMNQERKAKIATALKPILKKYGIKGSLSVHNHSTLRLNIKSGSIDFIENYIKTDADKPYGKDIRADQIDYLRQTQFMQVNPYWFHEDFSGPARAFLSAVLNAMNSGNHDNSNAQVDYFDVGWYVAVDIGKWNKPYQLTV